jgi:hypothetical protein
MRKIAGLIILISSMSVGAVPLDIAQFSLFSSIEGTVKQDDQLGFLGPAINNTEESGLSVTFVNNLDSNNLGSVTWELVNNSGSDIASSSLFGFLDAEIGVGSYWNEYGNTFGDVDTYFNYWEIDEPGYVFGDIYDNLNSGSLDNTNSVDSISADDVSFALGFDIDNWLAGESIFASFTLSDSQNGLLAGIQQTDIDLVDANTFYFSGSIQREIAQVDEPSSIALLIIGLLSLIRARSLTK